MKLIFFSLKIHDILTVSHIHNIHIESQLEHQNQIQETKEIGWIFDKINSMKMKFYKNSSIERIELC